MNQYLNSLSMSNALRNLGENWADLPPVADALLRISIVLILAWLVHAILFGGSYGAAVERVAAGYA